MPIVRNRTFTMYMFQRHGLINEHGEEVAQLVAPTDCNGLFPSHGAWQDLVEQVGVFYDSLNPAEIDSINRDILLQQEQRQEQQTANRPPPRQVPGYVYLLKGGDYYKIGISKNVNRRMEEISPRLPFKTALVCTIATQNMHKLEADLHELYADKHVRGEWFELNEQDVTYFKEMADD